MDMNRRVVIAGICLVLGLVSVDAQVELRWGRPNVPHSGACFYRDADFHGEYFCVRAGESVADMPNGMNDQISSIRIFGGTEVLLYQDGRFRGRSARYGADVRNLGGQGWNDKVSSIQVHEGSGWNGGERPPSWGQPQMPREGACFFTDADFRGQAFCVPRGGSYASLPNGFNDRISSIRVQRANVMIFQDGDFAGESLRVNSDVGNLGGRWNDRISSIRVY
jgi:hypothetical protein